MKKITYLLLLVFLFACGGSEDQVSTTQDTSVNLVDDSKFVEFKQGPYDEDLDKKLF